MKLIITENKYVRPEGERPHYKDVDTEFTNVKEYIIEGKFLTVIYENGERAGQNVSEMKKFKLLKE
jgi:hypothetical protein